MLHAKRQHTSSRCIGAPFSGWLSRTVRCAWKCRFVAHGGAGDREGARRNLARSLPPAREKTTSRCITAQAPFLGVCAPHCKDRAGSNVGLERYERLV